MLILLPPSEGKSRRTRGRPLDLARLSSPGLTPAREEMLRALVKVSSTPEAQQVLGLSDGLVPEIERNAVLDGAATARADRVYTGVLFDALDLPGLATAGKRRAAARLAITSSLYGMVRPADPIAAYRLSGDVTLPGLGSVAGHWRAHLGPAIAEAVGDGLLVDLRSGTYAAFWRPEPTSARRVATLRVLHEQDGVRKVVSHFNKATKGRIARALLTDGGNPRTPTALATLLRDLGWYVEQGEPTARGTQLDVVVADL